MSSTLEQRPYDGSMAFMDGNVECRLLAIIPSVQISIPHFGQQLHHHAIVVKRRVMNGAVAILVLQKDSQLVRLNFRQK